MIFTIGNRFLYESYFKHSKHHGPNGVPQKAKGGSVWKTFSDAHHEARKFGFGVYGVKADWDEDTEPLKPDAPNYVSRQLKRDADLCKVDHLL